MGILVVALILTSVIYHKVHKGKDEHIVRVLTMAVVSGIFGANFYILLAHNMDLSLKLIHSFNLSSPYSAITFFSIGALLSNIVLCTYFMKKPLDGKKINYQRYFAKHSHHTSGILGGIIFGAGLIASVIAAIPAGPVISYSLSQGATFIAALWGIFIWREFHSAGKTVYWIIGVMLACYLVGIFLVAYSH